MILMFEHRHRVLKLAGLLGPTEGDMRDAVLTGAAAAGTAGLVGGIPLQGLLYARALSEGKAPTEFGDVATLVRNVANLESADLPDKIRIFNGKPSLLPFLDYGALPDMSARSLHVTTGGLGPKEQSLILPWRYDQTGWGLDDLRRTFLGFTRGEKFDVRETPDILGEADELIRPDAPKGLWGKYQDLADKVLTARGDDLARRQRYSPSAVLHELGHLSRSSRAVPRGIWAAGLLGAAGAGIGTTAALSEDERIQAAAPLLATVPSLPTLVEEARATRGAGRMLEEMVSKGMADATWLRKFKLLTRPAYGTYLLGALTPAIAAGVTAKTINDTRDRSTLGDVGARIREAVTGLWDKGEDLADEL